MKKIITVILSVVLLSVAAPGTEAAAGPAKETYLYTSVPSGEGETESIEITITGTETGGTYSSRIDKDEERQETRIETDALGRFSAGYSRVSKSSGNDVRNTRSWRNGNTIYLEGDSQSVKAIKAPRGAEPALDGSILLLLRSFIKSNKSDEDVFLISFSGKSVKAKIRNTGIETVSVPAGNFECHRIEIGIPVLFTRSKITAWLTKNAPHGLIKLQGKRGPLTASYTTILVSNRKAS